ncbi:MAG: hypothetical protein ACRD0K_29160 [Egibacteraceae bacterium]
MPLTPDTPPQDSVLIPQQDDDLIEALAAAAARYDPVPLAVMEAARAAFTWRTIDAELAELAYDSLFDRLETAGVRGLPGPRLVTFEADDVCVEVEVHESGGLRRLIGQIVPQQPGLLTVRHEGGSQDVEADAVGRFQLSNVAAGPVSLQCRLQDRAIETEWVVL